MSEINELVGFQRELKEEEQLILSMLRKIDVQLHALQVEQLQLLNAKNSSKDGQSVPQNFNDNKTASIDANKTAFIDANVKKELDLVVPHVWQESEDDDEEEESS